MAKDKVLRPFPQPIRRATDKAGEEIYERECFQCKQLYWNSNYYTRHCSQHCANITGNAKRFLKEATSIRTKKRTDRILGIAQFHLLCKTKSYISKFVPVEIYDYSTKKVLKINS